jgi:Uma2 family endonuclease
MMNVMADAARDIPIISANEYLAREEAGETRHEFVNGVVYAMVGASQPHNVIAGNLFAALHGHLPDRCAVFTSDMKVRIALDRAEHFYYPDVMVCCGPIDRSLHYREDPVLLAEVLSPATERTDRAEKFDTYRGIPALEEYVLVAQDMPRVEIFRRQTDWRRETFAMEDTFRLECVDFAMAVEALYRRVTF